MAGSLLRFGCSMVILCSLALCPVIRATAQEAQASLDTMLERAEAAQNAGDYQTAALWYGRATSLAPGMAELWSNRGVMELLAGKREEAIISMKHSLALDPSLYTPKLFLGKAYVETGRPGKALQWLRRAHAARPDDIEALLTLGQASMQDGQGRASAAAYSAATLLAPNNADAWFGLGVAALHVIEDDADRLATSYASSVWSRALLADDFLAQGKPIQATDTYNDALHEAIPAQRTVLYGTMHWMLSQADFLALPNNSVRALRVLVGSTPLPHGVSLAGFCAAPSARGGDTNTLQEAACAFWAGHFERSATLAEASLPHTSDPAQALYWSVKSSERLAVDALARFESLSTQSAANFVLVGNLFRVERQPDKALAEYAKALALDPSNPAALKGSVLASLDGGQIPEAAAFDRTALVDQPFDPELNLLMAEVLDTEESHTGEASYLARAFGVPPELQPRLHYLMARLDVREGKTAKAIEEFKLALPGDKDGRTHYQLSRLYRQTGNQVAARQTMAEAKALIAKRDASAAVIMQQAAPPRP